MQQHHLIGGDEATDTRASSVEQLAVHQPWMLARAFEYTRNRADAQEAVQESFLRYLQRAPAEVDNKRAYLSRILENVLHASRRAFGRFERVTDVAHFSESQASPSAYEEFELAERRSQAQAALAVLKPRQRRVLLLLSEGLSPREIAPLLGITPHAVSALEMRAKLNLKVALLKQGFAPALIGWVRVRARLLRTLDTAKAQSVESLVALSVAAAIPLLSTTMPENFSNPLSESPVVHTNQELAAKDIGLDSQSHSPTPTFAGGPKGSSMPSSSPGGHFDAPTTTEVGLQREDNGGDPEPPLQDQILNYVSEPGAIPMPSCEGTIPCPGT